MTNKLVVGVLLIAALMGCSTPRGGGYHPANKYMPEWLQALDDDDWFAIGQLADMIQILIEEGRK